MDELTEQVSTGMENLSVKLAELGEEIEDELLTAIQGQPCLLLLVMSS